MPNINLSSDYFEHIKTKRLVSKLGEKAAVIPIRLWCYASVYHPVDGMMVNYSSNEIKLITKWRGDVICLLNSLIDVGFLERTADNSYKLHDWENHQGHIISFSERGKANAKIRWNKYREAVNESKQRKSEAPKGVNSTPL